MLKNKIYICEICKTKPDQLSHHKTHLETQKHKDKKELFKLKLSKLSPSELQKIYNTTDINIIIDENETNTFIFTEEKKLTNTYNNEENNNIMSNEDEQKIEKSQNVSNKEALKDKIHEIHNYLRNNGAGYGMNALKVFNLLYGLKKIEEKKLLDKVNLKRPDCEFSYLLKIANENKDQILSDLIRENVLDSINESSIKNLLLYEIPTNVTGKTLCYLIKEIDKITIIEKTCNVLLSGKIYEYFIGRDESAISELGAYFTDRHIVDYIYEKLDPKINEDGSINSMIDMFGGSGGFTTGYINYLNNKYENIKWKNNINQIYHFDMNEDVIKSAGLEFFCLTGVLPNMKDNLKYKNSFTDEFNNMKFKNVITNPPYGGDKVVQSDAQIKRKKIKDYIKKEIETLKDELTIKTRMRQLKKIEAQEKQEKIESDKTKVSINTCSQRIIKYAKNYKLSGNDKESSSLILIMDMVDVNGTAIGVLKEGVFFNKTYKDIRKCLVENFNVREIISVPQDQFENTSTKTSIVIFDNTEEKTSTVKFLELIVEKYTEDKFEEIAGEIVLTESKDDISGISDRLVSEATKEDILKNPIYSLNGKDYNKKEIICGKDYELKKLGDISNFLQKSKRKASDGKSEGKYNFYTSSDKVQKCDFVDYKDECIIIGSGGVANIKMDQNFSCSADNFIITSKYNQYIFNFIKGNMHFLSDGFTGSTLKHISKEYLQNLQIPIPKDEKKIKEWVDKISKSYNKKNENEQKIKKLEYKIKDRIKEITHIEDCEEVNFDSLLTYVSKKNKYRASDGYSSGLYKFFTSSQEKILYRNDYEFEDTYLLIGRGGSPSVHIASKFSVSHDDVYVLKLNENNNGLLQYIYNYIKLNDNLLLNSFKGSTIKHCSKEGLTKLKIKIPKNKKLIQKLEPLFEEIEKLQSEMKDVELQYKQIIKELVDEAIPTNNQEVKLIELLEESEEDSNNIKKPIIETKIKKSKVSKKKDKTIVI